MDKNISPLQKKGSIFGAGTFHVSRLVAMNRGNTVISFAYRNKSKFLVASP